MYSSVANSHRSPCAVSYSSDKCVENDNIDITQSTYLAAPAWCAFGTQWSLCVYRLEPQCQPPTNASGEERKEEEERHWKEPYLTDAHWHVEHITLFVVRDEHARTHGSHQRVEQMRKFTQHQTTIIITHNTTQNNTLLIVCHVFFFQNSWTVFEIKSTKKKTTITFLNQDMRAKMLKRRPTPLWTPISYVMWMVTMSFV